jgi:glyoxylase-like metal-dependent hydrolase (beta-lactamase superfamily II)
MRPCPTDRIRGVTDGTTIALGDRSLGVVHTPGHASHHIALHDSGSGSMLTGEAIGSYLPWAATIRPALPPPEVDVPQALASIETMRARRPTALLTSHFGPVPDPATAFDLAAERIVTWSETIRREIAADPDIGETDLVHTMTELARAELLASAGLELDDVVGRYDALGSIRMNAQGLARYWRKRTGPNG